MQIDRIVRKKVNITNVPVDCVPMLLVEVTLEQKKTVKKVQVHLGGRIRQQVLGQVLAILMVVINSKATAAFGSIQTPPPQHHALPLTSASVN